jgi:putative DNA primase/helicase
MMSVERKFQDVREIEPFAKHIILTNHMPRIRDYSDGLFRRISIINLHRQFMGSSADPYLLDKLKGEMDAITSRALDALQRLIEGNGKFTQPESSQNAKLKWKADNNHVEQFISDCLYPLPNNQVGVLDMYDAYIEWFKTTGLRGQLGRKQFVYRMEALGIEKTTRNSGGYSFKEVELR